MAKKKTEAASLEPTTRKFAEELLVALPLEVLLQRSDQLQDLNEKIAVLETEFAKKKSDHKEKIEVLDYERKTLNETLKAHAEKRMVECEEKSDLGTNRVTVVRLDTLEMVSERAMTPDEREALVQPEIPYQSEEEIRSIVENAEKKNGFSVEFNSEP